MKTKIEDQIRMCLLNDGQRRTPEAPRYPCVSDSGNLSLKLKGKSVTFLKITEFLRKMYKTLPTISEN